MNAFAVITDDIDIDDNTHELKPKKKAKAPLPPVRKESLSKENGSPVRQVDQNGNVSSRSEEDADSLDGVDEMKNHVIDKKDGMVAVSEKTTTLSYTESVQYSEKIVTKNADEGVDASFNDLELNEMKELGKNIILQHIPIMGRA